jgi:hypothetical protein
MNRKLYYFRTDGGTLVGLYLTALTARDLGRECNITPREVTQDTLSRAQRKLRAQRKGATP